MSTVTGTPPNREAKVSNASTVTVWGTGSDVTIKHLAQTVQRVVGCMGEIAFDATTP